MGGSSSAHLYEQLHLGLSRDDAEKLWRAVDRNGDGKLDAREAKQLVVKLAEFHIKRLEEAKDDPDYIQGVLRDFDADRDGQVAKEEFIQKAIEGYRLPLEASPDFEDDDEEDLAQQEATVDEEAKQEALGAAEKGAKQEATVDDSNDFHDALEEPPTPAGSVTAPKAAEPAAKRRRVSEEELKQGQKVRIHDITMPEAKILNGWKGTLMRYNADKQRWMVKLNQMIVPTPTASLTIVTPGGESAQQPEVETMASARPDHDEEVTDVPGFTPSIKLELLELFKTGEEDEQEIFKQRTKLFRFRHGQWVERGIGEAKLLKRSSSGGKVRFLFRQEDTLVVRANHEVIAHDTYCDLKPQGGSDKIWVWSAYDCSDDPNGVEMFALKFGKAELAAAFKEKFDASKS